MSENQDKNQMNRRAWFKSSAGAAGGAAAFIGLGPAKAVFAKTPAQTEGPFHPVNRDTDLTRKEEGDPLAAGEIIEVEGQVTDDQTHESISGAVVELWQADANGFYDHPSDPRQGDRDPHFQFWGRATTDAKGRYGFRTIKPGSYPAAPGWERPPHLHVRVLRRGYQDITTQMYFADEPELNGKDRLLQALSPSEQEKLVVSFDHRSPRQGRFDLQLRPV